MGLKNFYRFFFSGHYQTARNDGNAFHSLYEFTATLGFQVYSLAFQTVILLVLICTGVAFVKGYSAKNAQGRIENKDKIMRNILILLIAVSLSFIIATTYRIFSWRA